MNAARIPPRQPTPDRRWIVGIALVALYLTQALAGWQWDWLAALQEMELYKQLSGFGLAVLFLAQWRLSVARMAGIVRRATGLLKPHQHWGVAAPLLLYLHADEFGHAYIRVLCLAFLALVFLGLMYQPILRLKRASATTTWLVTHVVLATMLAFLIGYHGFNAFYYE